MTKENPVIIQFETDDYYQHILDLVLYNMGLDSAVKVKSIDENKAMFKRIESKNIVPDVVVIDTYMKNDNEDGRKIADRIRQISPNTKIVGYSIMQTNEWADFEIIKTNRDVEKTIIKVLEQVLEREFNYSDQEDPEFTHEPQMN